MSQYRFVGGYAELLDTPYKFARVGQPVEMKDDLAFGARSGKFGAKIALLPSAEFDQFFAGVDWKRWADPRTHAQAPREFLETLAAAQHAALNP